MQDGFCGPLASVVLSERLSLLVLGLVASVFLSDGVFAPSEDAEGGPQATNIKEDRIKKKGRMSIVREVITKRALRNPWRDHDTTVR